MLLPYTTLTYYGPGAAAAINVSAPTATADIKGNAALTATGVAIALSPLARATSGRRMAAFDMPSPTADATLRGRARISAVGVIGVITQDDVTGAVWQAQVVPGKTYHQAIVELLAASAGGGSLTVEQADQLAVAARNSGLIPGLI